MKENIIILSLFITFSCSTQTSKDEKVDSNLFEFKDLNNITSFYKSNDTFFALQLMAHSFIIKIRMNGSSKTL